MPTTPKAAPEAPSTASLRTDRDSSGISTASATLRVLPASAHVANKMRIGKTELKNWAAIVIDRSKMSTRTPAAALWVRMRPSHRD